MANIEVTVEKPGLYATKDNGGVYLWSVDEPGWVFEKRNAAPHWLCVRGDWSACLPISEDSLDGVVFGNEGRPVPVVVKDPKATQRVTEPATGDKPPIFCGDCGADFDPLKDPGATMLCEKCRREQEEPQ